MSQTIGLVANVYNEAYALPGWLETHLPYFDDVRVYHAGPQGEHSHDGTIEILEAWNVPVQFGSIDEGFGIVRTKAIRSSPCDWVMLLDADERFYPLHHVLTCHGEATPQGEVDDILQSYDFTDIETTPINWENLSRLGSNLSVAPGALYDQGQWLRQIIETINGDGTHYDAVQTARRHWHDFSFRKPTQNWMSTPDWQCRILRNDMAIHFDPSTRMHENLVGASKVFRGDPQRGPFFDHFHFTFKAMEQGQRAHDVAIYNAIHHGEQPPPTWGEFRKGGDDAKGEGQQTEAERHEVTAASKPGY